MPYFAKIQPTANASIYTVTEVISADQSFIDSGAVGDPSVWIQTSYNTYGGIHYAPSPPAQPGTPDGGVALRGNYAGIGYIYDQANDVFYTQRPSNQYGVFNSWTIGAPTWLWQPPNPPGPAPEDGKTYEWDEQTLSWVVVTTGVTPL